jgi:hypothetical protein
MEKFQNQPNKLANQLQGFHTPSYQNHFPAQLVKKCKLVFGTGTDRSTILKIFTPC